MKKLNSIESQKKLAHKRKMEYDTSVNRNIVKTFLSLLEITEKLENQVKSLKNQNKVMKAAIQGLIIELQFMPNIGRKYLSEIKIDLDKLDDE